MEIGDYPTKATKKLGDGGDVLIVAGDLTCARFFQSQRSDSDAKKHQRYMDKFVNEWTTKFKRTYYVMGNHEHYGFLIPESSKVLGEYLKGTNIKILDPGSEVFEDVLFVGATLWTDFNGNDFDTKTTIRYSMNDYRTIYHKHAYELTAEEKQSSDLNIKSGLITPNFIMEAHNYDKTFLDFQLRNVRGMKTVVITHHAPRMEFNGDHSTGLIHGYCSDQSALIDANPQIALWACGHTHCNRDFYQGNTRLVSNCRGYDGHESIARDFAPKFVEI